MWEAAEKKTIVIFREIRKGIIISITHIQKIHKKTFSAQTQISALRNSKI